MALHIGPFGENDAVEVGVAHRPVPAGLVVTDHAILLRTQCLDRPLRLEIEIVRAQPHHLAAERLEGVFEQDELASGIHVASLSALRIPGVADLHSIDIGDDIVIPRAADDGA